ncbi:MAG: cytochrome d ubiquinol oxidase subunit II [Chloracidobacterium sp.]|nr:cytochrome d ubiquinol oxidase subunit II [Chloracidobacterium sp.]
MLSIDALIAGAMMVSLTFYVLLGGADFGGGVWDMLASGPRKQAQRGLIAEAISPVWEANHVWLILVVVLLFTAFPPAFAAVAIALHIPLTLMLIGIVLRGSAFTFRNYDKGTDDAQRRWGRIFSMTSLITPVLLGVIVGAISSGLIRNEYSDFGAAFIYPWLAPFPFAVGLFALALFAFMAAVYLIVEARDEALREDFRLRALISAVAVGLMALVVFLLSGSGAPLIRHWLTQSWWTWPLQISTAVFAVGAIYALWTRRFRTARFCAAAQAALILWGWGAAHYPYLIAPDLTIYNTAAPVITLRIVWWTLLAGSVLLFPSLYYLFRVFKWDAARGDD